MFFFVLWGFLTWFVVTTAVRIAGQFFFNPESLSLLLLTFGVAVPLIALVTYPVYSWRKVKPSERPLAVMYMVLPGMLLDVFIILLFPYVFPNLSPTVVTPFSAWLLWGYTLALLTGFIPKLSYMSLEVAPEQK